MSFPSAVQLTDENGLLRAAFNPVAKTIVDGSATTLFNVALPANSINGGVIFYSIIATDNTDFQSLTGMVTYAAVSKVAVQTLTITELDTNQAKAASAGTLTVAWSYVAGTGVGVVKITPTGSLTEVAPYTIIYTVLPLRGTVTIQ